MVFIGVCADDDGVKTYADKASMLSTGIDHLLYASANLQRGIDEIESLLGVRPVRGGHHPQYGTHNALLSLGPGIYLEIIARDPDLPAPERGAFVNIPAEAHSHLITWVFRTKDIQQALAAAHNAAIGLGPVESGSRRNPDGSEICWQLTDPYAMPMNGAVPFLIDWGETVHPSAVVPPGGQLAELVIEHPEADSVRRALSVLGAAVEVTYGDNFRISAKIEAKYGSITLR
jgi:hypothetical protein